MADHANSTPRAISRRFLFSVAATVPIAALPAKSPASAAPTDPAGQLATLLLGYRDVGLQLQALDTQLAAAMETNPEWARPGPGANGESCRWAKWSRTELDALGLPSSMTSRP
jgi:hypothetical protein